MVVVPHPNPAETNCAVDLVVQLGKLSLVDAATAIVLGEMLGQKFFSSLRTEQQLGYIVSLSMTDARGVYGLRLLVQSSTATPQHVTDSMHEFLANTASKLLTDTEDADLTSYVTAARQELVQKPTSLSDAADPLWSRVVDDSLDFARREKLAEQLGSGSVTLAALSTMLARVQPPSKDAGRAMVWILAATGEAASDAGDGLPEGYDVVASTDEFRSGLPYFEEAVDSVDAPQQQQGKGAMGNCSCGLGG